ncbi:MAG: 30S ribosomal protein S17 [Candidatus Kerfeldbacteria bacterium]|nr:30S ribosomal protein S17 [Candidatus Kerfeldbacteria bacterium]
MTENIAHRRKLTGTIVSDKMDKTVVVRVSRTKIHPRYGKRYTESTKFKAHDDKNEFHTGDLVMIEETRPLSKQKRWRVLKKLGTATEAGT